MAAEENNQNSNGSPQVSFSKFIMMLSTQALMQLGIIPNPLTEEKGKDLPGAQLTIESIAMLKEKTSGNLDPEEDKMLDSVLHNLRLRFVDMVRQVAPGEPDGEAE